MAKRPFNDPFEKLRDHPAGKPAPKPPPWAPPAPPPPPAERTAGELWEEAVAGARRLDPGHGTVAPRSPKAAPGRVWHPDLDAVDELRALVSGDSPFDLADSDEFIEGWVEGLDHKIVAKLRRGEFAVQGHVDLHGLKRDEAKRAVEEFLRGARLAGKRCVLVVHGRGLHSKDQVPVLKDAVRGWLATHRFGRHVLAFATAKPVDGGAGALYVLLRKPGRG
ncbi:MAG TPA: Smr/MutS family protein [Anaeromyxobacteraceae bacterium]|nr:Smr/MutS family protein [Anaeromyxobacteraceae bacterium]